MAFDDQHITASYIYDTLTEDAGLAALFNELTGSSDVQVFDTDVPQGDEYDDLTLYIIFNVAAAGENLHVMGAVKVWSNTVITIKVVGRELQYKQLSEVYGAIYSLLNGTTNTSVIGDVHGFYEESSGIKFGEVDNGVTWRHLGGTWRVYAKAA